MPAFPDFRKSGYLDIRISGFPDIRVFFHARVCQVFVKKGSTYPNFRNTSVWPLFTRVQEMVHARGKAIDTYCLGVPLHSHGSSC